MLIDATTDIGSRIIGAIQDAARATGTGFDYLLKTAMRESSFNPNAKASTSSATGLFQFIDQTWLATLKQSGPELGYARYSDAIVRTGSGRYVVPDPAMRSKIMDLRYDPKANAAMAGEFTRRNGRSLAGALGRAPTDGELYIAHFLGPSGAIKLISATERTPHASAADLFPDAARANRPIFYDKQGSARSLAQVYGVLVAKHDVATATLPAIRGVDAVAAPIPPAPIVVAAAPVPPASAPPPAIPPTPPTVAVRAASTETALPPATTAYAPTPGPAFRSLFSDDPREGVSPFVRDLWGPGNPASAQLASAVAPPAASTAAPAATTGRIGSPLDLFQFLRPEIRAQLTPAA